MEHIKKIEINLQKDMPYSGKNIVKILSNRIKERCGVEILNNSNGYPISLKIVPKSKSEGFSLYNKNNATQIVGNSFTGLLYGVGKFLHSSNYSKDGISPSKWRGRSTPDCEFRGIDIEVHAHNWYQVAPKEEIEQYVEDLALWGVNVISSVFPFLNLSGWNDNEVENSLEQIKTIFKKTKELGLKTCILAAPNSQFSSSMLSLHASPLPEDSDRARCFFNGTNLCPNIPEAKTLIISNFRKLFEEFSDIGIDYFCSWPYDEGGCGCNKCYPWGANGYIGISKEVSELSREYFKNLKFILSTWFFDYSDWEGLDRILGVESSWLDYVMADSSNGFPDYPIKRKIFERIPLLNFPEISMWGMFPWGGFGANPMPRRFQSRWNSTKHFLSGGFPYSEGIFDDINKVLFSQFYWNKNVETDEILREYSSYYISSTKLNEILNIIYRLEVVHTNSNRGNPIDKKYVQKTNNIAEDVNAKLLSSFQKNWRWKIIYLRTILDREFFNKNTITSATAQQALRKLIGIYHAKLVDDGSDLYHFWVRPPLSEGKSINSEEHFLNFKKKKIGFNS